MGLATSPLLQGRNGAVTLVTAFFVATPTAEDLRNAAAANTVAGVSSAAGDGQQMTALDPLKQMQVADKVAANSAARQPHFGLRMVKLVPPGCG